MLRLPYLPWLSYRQGDMTSALPVGVQKSASDLACSGVMFSIDTETGFKNAALITAAYGLGKTWFKAVNPMNTFFKPTLKKVPPDFE